MGEEGLGGLGEDAVGEVEDGGGVGYEEGGCFLVDGEVHFGLSLIRFLVVDWGDCGWFGLIEDVMMLGRYAVVFMCAILGPSLLAVSCSSASCLFGGWLSCGRVVIAGLEKGRDGCFVVVLPTSIRVMTTRELAS